MIEKSTTIYWNQGNRFSSLLANSVQSLFQVDVSSVKCLADNGALSTKQLQYLEVG